MTKHADDEFSYLDETKNKRKCILIDYKTKKPILDKTAIHCFWCHHPFDTAPISCPVKYVPHVLVKKYYSFITKDNYTIKEELSPRRYEHLLSTPAPPGAEMKFVKGDHYLVDGIFCSYNCTVSWIHDHVHDPLYQNSLNLLNDMYIRRHNVEPDAFQITPAPSWRMLQAYGGPMTIEEFRESFDKVIYGSPQCVRQLPFTKRVGMVFEEFLKI